MAIKYFKVLHGAWRQIPDTAILTDGKKDETKLNVFIKQGFKIRKQDADGKLSFIELDSNCDLCAKKDKEIADLKAEIKKLKEAKKEAKPAPEADKK